MKTKKPEAKIRVLIVDDHQMVRLGLVTLLKSTPDLDVVGEADSIASAMQEIQLHKPDIVLLDLRLKDGSGIEVCRQSRALASPSKFLVLTSYASDAHLIDTVEAGADGYLLKDVDGDHLIEAIRQIMAGENIFDPVSTLKILRKVGSPMGASSAEQKLRQLSNQEMRVLEILAQGKTNKEIAQVLCLSDKTVKNYLFNLMCKLGLSRRAEAVAFYLSTRPADKLI